MSLAQLETAVVELVGDVLVNECDRPVPDRVLRYHGLLPHDCCTDNGFLVVSWEREYPTTRFPAAAAGGNDCPGVPAALLTLRYVVCWPVPEVGPNGVILIDDTWDTQAAMLADVADCVARALLRLTCDPDFDDPFVAAVLTHAGRNRIQFIDATPIAAQGGCAGVQWRLYSGVRLGAVS